jgi:hypothetical protein
MERSALQAGRRPIQNSNSVVMKGNTHLQNSNSHFSEEESGPSLTIRKKIQK